jgi:hypothetical protein
MDGADHHEPRLRQMRVEKESSPFRLDGTGIARPKCPSDRGSEIAGDLIALTHDAIAAITEIGDEDRRAAGTSFGIQSF